MNPFLVKAIAAQRKIEDCGSLDQFDAEIISFALHRLIRAGRVPFQRLRDHIILGTERWKILDGLDFFRAILMHRKSEVWYPDSDMSQLPVFAVYASSQVQPPDENVFDSDRGKPSDYADDLYDRDTPPHQDEYVFQSKIGPSVSSGYQKILEEAVPDAQIMDTVGTVQQSLRRYAKELSGIDSMLATEHRNELEAFFRKRAKSATDKIPDDELIEVTDAYLSAQFYRGKPRTMPGPKQKVCDAVRKSCEYARKKMLESSNPMTRAIGQHLADNVVIGQTCEYKGDWKWLF